ncbi:uncharacterized protein AB675_8619 [Cyphellophora attinorum]|uniref:YDG domain-containing protein n=1 Tax=Cyphellophora attinorum TaxID=1664694 RepID=A0A0N0NR43_9EURO|nr:uncharacterized protein AB675_8619 [Phialophora attinorum]KPI44399.1 hypothetical protein AB675_8619 [Phialophora attinorum]
MVRIKEEDRDGESTASSSRHMSHDIPPHQTPEPGEVPTEPAALRLPPCHPLWILQAAFAENDRVSRADMRKDTNAENTSIYGDFEGRRNPRTRRRPDDSHASTGSSHSSRSTDEENIEYISERRRFPSLSPTRHSSRTSSASSNRRPDGRASDCRPPNLSPAKFPPPVPDAKALEGPKRCECPIHLTCGVRDDNWIDCRILVPIWEKWRKAQREVDPWAQIPEDEIENFATPVAIRAICPLLDELANLLGTPRSIDAVCNDVRVWLWNMRMFSVREDDINAEDPIQRIDDFLSDYDAMTGRAKRLPDDIKEDLTIQLRKWQRGDFGVLPHRAFVRDGKGRWIRNANWNHRDGRFFGDGHLVNGQTFKNRRIMASEGAHAPPQAGISGNTRDGAYSVVMGLHEPSKQMVYADVDCGDTIYYISTALPLKEDDQDPPTNHFDPEDEALYVDPETATVGARALMISHETRQPVRVFRSYKAAPIVPNKPVKGFRYDGLYRVEDVVCLKQKRQIYRFKMVRLRGQGALRGMLAVSSNPRTAGTKKRREPSGGENAGSSRSVKRSRK